MRVRRRNWLIIISLGAGLSITQACSKTDFGPAEESQVVKIDAPATTQALSVSDMLSDDQIDQGEQELIQQYSCDKKNGRGKKALVCHYPSGNPANRHEICVSIHALKAHLGRHGQDDHKDHLGPCRLSDAYGGSGDGGGDSAGGGDGGEATDGSGDPTCGPECEVPTVDDINF